MLLNNIKQLKKKNIFIPSILLRNILQSKTSTFLNNNNLQPASTQNQIYTRIIPKKLN